MTKRSNNRAQPPQLARKLFALVAGSAHVDDLLGDMDEWFHDNLKSHSLMHARWVYWRQVLSLSFSYALRKRKRDASHGAYAASMFNLGMLNNYIKVAVRNLHQFKYFSFINAFGLALGMSVSLLLISIYSYVSTYDNFHPRAEDVFAITSTVDKGTEQVAYATAPTALADKITAEFPAAEKVLTVVKEYHTIVTKAENFPVKAYYTTPDLFDLFSFSFVEGSPNALNSPGQAILTERTSQLLFGDSGAMGKTLELEGGALVQVTGIIKNPKQTHLSFNLLISYASLPATSSTFVRDWIEFPQQYVYVRMREHASADDMEEYLTATSERLYKNTTAQVSFELRPLHQMTVGPDLRNDIGEKWETSGFLVFAIFAALILLPACFNYANISIARAMRRAKEIALRKTVGGVRTQIFFQFVTETILITLISLVGALGIFVLIRNEFQSMLVAGASLDLSLTPRMLVWFILFAIVTGLCAGIFPALYFARMNPIEALQSRVSMKAATFSVRKVLTVFQFVLSFGFILTLFAINRQYRYAMSFDFGFQKQQIVDVALQDVTSAQFLALFSNLSSVTSVSQSSGILGVTASQTWLMDSKRDSVLAAQMFVDRNYINNLGLTFIAGHNFPDEPWSRERYVVVNEQFLRMKKIATPLDAVGKIYQADGKDLEVIGVLKDFHYAPLNYPIGNFMFREDPTQFHYANLKVTSGDSFDVLSQLETTWDRLPTEKKFLARFFEDEMLESYETYTAMLKIVGFLGLLAITISLLGLIGMVVYTSQSRTREVGIRKVMGADIRQVVLLLSRDYLKMLAWAIAVGTPVTVVLLNATVPHLQYYHTSISALDVVLSILVLVLFGVGTIVFETYKTAVTNPATTLRSE